MTRLDEMISLLEQNDDGESAEAKQKLRETLVEARDRMKDRRDEADADRILSEIIANLMEAEEDKNEADQKYMEETAAAIEEAFEKEGWKYTYKRERREDLTEYQMSFSAEQKSLRMTIMLEDRPKRIRLSAALPFTGDKTYEYLLCKAIADANSRFIYGAYHYDKRDGEITYEYSYPINHGFYSDDFIRMIRIVIQTALDDDAFPVIRKAASGRYTNAEREQLLNDLLPMIEDLTAE